MKTFADRTNRALLLLLLIVVSSVKAGVVTTGGGRMTSLTPDKQDPVERVSEMEQGAIRQKGMFQGVSTFNGSRRLMMMGGGMPGSSSTGSKSGSGGGGGGSSSYGWYSGQYAPTENSTADKKVHPMARNLAIGGVGVALVVIAAAAAWMEKRKRRDALKAAAILGSSSSSDSSTIMTADSAHRDSAHRHCGRDSPYII